jgi:hypothetical protein
MAWGHYGGGGSSTGNIKQRNLFSTFTVTEFITHLLGNSGADFWEKFIGQNSYCNFSCYSLYTIIPVILPFVETPLLFFWDSIQFLHHILYDLSLSEIFLFRMFFSMWE